jgi:recombinational DNA repair ATPase RecF
MHIRRIHLREYKCFTELIVEIPVPARLVMMCGPNGSGKSSLLEQSQLRESPNKAGNSKNDVKDQVDAGA